MASPGSHDSNKPRTSPPDSTVVPWARLRAWIDEKEAYENKHGQPAHLTDRELAAISQLVPFYKDDEPDVGVEDHVSDLMRYTQSKRLDPPTWSEDSVRIVVDGHMQTKWRCFCSLGSLSERFPCEDYGVTPGGEVPAFQSKKKAKQFAAQQVIAFLGASQRGRPPAFSPPNGSANANTNNGLSHPSAFSNKRRRPSSSTSSPQPASRTPDRHGRFLSSSSSLSSSSVTPVATKEAVRDLSVFEYVRSLADELGLENPTYHLASEAELPDFWSGRPIFKAGSKVPDGVGAVREVLGKQNAKVQTAQKTLAWLQGEKQRRQAELAAILQSLKSQ